MQEDAGCWRMQKDAEGGCGMQRDAGCRGMQDVEGCRMQKEDRSH
jgi:hypothetical protein